MNNNAFCNSENFTLVQITRDTVSDILSQQEWCSQSCELIKTTDAHAYKA